MNMWHEEDIDIKKIEKEFADKTVEALNKEIEQFEKKMKSN